MSQIESVDEEDPGILPYVFDQAPRIFEAADLPIPRSKSGYFDRERREYAGVLRYLYYRKLAALGRNPLLQVSLLACPLSWFGLIATLTGTTPSAPNVTERSSNDPSSPQI